MCSEIFLNRPLELGERLILIHSYGKDAPMEDAEILFSKFDHNKKVRLEYKNSAKSLNGY
jgi:hypothetical protein